MASRRALASIAIVVLGIATLAGCSPHGSADAARSSSQPDVASSRGDNNGSEGAHVMSEKQELIEFDVRDEPVLAQSSNSADFIDTTPFTPTTGRVAIYSDCIGTGRIIISLGDAVESSYDCRLTAENGAHSDDVVIDASQSYSISVSTTENQSWAVVVTELPAE